MQTRSFILKNSLLYHFIIEKVIAFFVIGLSFTVIMFHLTYSVDFSTPLICLYTGLHLLFWIIFGIFIFYKHFYFEITVNDEYLLIRKVFMKKQRYCKAFLLKDIEKIYIFMGSFSNSKETMYELRIKFTDGGMFKFGGTREKFLIEQLEVYLNNAIKVRDREEAFNDLYKDFV